jgi:hypothetical protein
MKKNSIIQVCLMLFLIPGTIGINGHCFAAMSNSILNGDYIGFEQRMGFNGSDDWGGLRALMTFRGDGTGTYNYLETDYGPLQSGSFTYTVNPDGSFTLREYIQGVISDDGKIGTLLDIDTMNKHASLGVVMKKSSGMSNANFNGEYIAVQKAIYGTSQKNAFRGILTANGKGSMNYKVLESISGSGSGSVKYTVKPDGALTLGEDINGIISSDGRIAAVFELDKESNFTEFYIAIRKSTGMSNTKLKGDYIFINQDTNGKASRGVVTFNGNGTGKYQDMETSDGNLKSGSLTYAVSPDGTYALTANGVTGRGIITTDGKIGTRLILGDDYALLGTMIQKNPIPSPPSSLTSMASSSTQIVLGWKDNATNETGFMIEQKTGVCNSSNPWGEIASTSANTKTHTVTELTPNTTYSFRVKANNSYGDSASYSNCSSAKTGASGTPPAPTNLKATSASSTKINLAWKDSSTNETGFKIYRKAGSDPWTLRTTPGSNAKTFTDTTANNNSSATIYQYYVQAFNESGNSPSTYPATVPYPPINLTASQGTNAGSIQLTWADMSANETGFEIYRKSGNCSSTDTWTKVATLGANKNTWTDTGRIAGTTYSYKIRSYKKAGSILSAYGYSMWSDCKSAIAPL